MVVVPVLFESLSVVGKRSVRFETRTPGLRSRQPDRHDGRDAPGVHIAAHARTANTDVGSGPFLKRQMVGRAKLDLLRVRVLHPN